MRPRTLIVVIIFWLLAASPAAFGQGEHWEPYTLKPAQTELHVWTSGERTFARVVVTFPDGGYRIVDWGQVARQGSTLSVDIIAEHWTGGATQAIVVKENSYDLGPLPSEPGTFTFVVRSRGAEVRRVTFDPRQIVERWEETSLDSGGVVHTVSTVGSVTFASAILTFPDTGYRVVEWGEVVRAGNDFSVTVRLEHFTGRVEAKKFIGERRVFVLGDGLPPNDTFTFTVRFTDGAAHTSHPFTPAGQRVNINPAEHPTYFVRQHYLDFFSREPDTPGLNYWTNEITNTCGGFYPDCIEVKRVNTSAAFFLSIEFQGTGYFVYRLHKAATGLLPRFERFMADTREVGRGVVVGREGWQAKLEANRQAFLQSFVARPEFAASFPESMTPEQFVDTLNINIAHVWSELEGGPLTPAERQQLADGLRGGTETRASVLFKVAEHAEFRRYELNRAFVQMQYFGYLRRNADDPPDGDWRGFNYWLGKLNSHHGDYQSAEMVKSFLVSQEYLQRFRQD